MSPFIPEFEGELLWPWILTAMHKGPARAALIRILRETLAGAEPMRAFRAG